MRRNSLNAPAWALVLALAGLTGCAGDMGTTEMTSEDPDAEAAGRYAEFTGQDTKRADCVAAGGTTVEGMPATQHQAQVLDAGATGAIATEPAAGGCPETGEMPATQHQEQLLDDDAADQGDY